MNLSAKLGPLPRWAWLLIAAVGGYLLYRHFSHATSNAGAEQTQSFITTTGSGAGGDTGLVPQAGSPTDSGATTDSMLSSYGSNLAEMNSSLLDALTTQGQNIVTLAQSQIAAAQANGTSPSTTTETQPLVAQQPGGSGAPVVFYVNPSATGGSTAPAAATTAARSSAVTKPTRYYTLRSQVALAPGQTVHFRTGKGYYAA